MDGPAPYALQAESILITNSRGVMHKCTTESDVVYVRVGDVVPDFKMPTYEPKAKEFGEFDLAKQRENGRWTVLFFYPADYTFV